MCDNINVFLRLMGVGESLSLQMDEHEVDLLQDMREVSVTGVACERREA